MEMSACAEGAPSRTQATHNAERPANAAIAVVVVVPAPRTGEQLRFLSFMSPIPDFEGRRETPAQGQRLVRWPGRTDFLAASDRK